MLQKRQYWASFEGFSSLKEQSESTPAPGDVTTAGSAGSNVGNVDLRSRMSSSLCIAERAGAPKLVRRCESL